MTNLVWRLDIYAIIDVEIGFEKLSFTPTFLYRRERGNDIYLIDFFFLRKINDRVRKERESYIIKNSIEPDGRTKQTFPTYTVAFESYAVMCFIQRDVPWSYAWTYLLHLK